MVPPKRVRPASAALTRGGHRSSLRCVRGRSPGRDAMSIDTAPPAGATDALPATMRAAVFTGGGKPLELRIVARPTPGPGELLVRVVACGLCHSDLHYLDHGTPTFKEPPLILGH